MRDHDARNLESSPYRHGYLRSLRLIASISNTLAVSSNHSRKPVFHVKVGTNSQIDYDSSHASPVHIVGDTMHLAGLLSGVARKGHTTQPA